MHKKDRPMLSVTALLYGSTAPSPVFAQSPTAANLSKSARESLDDQDHGGLVAIGNVSVGSPASNGLSANGGLALTPTNGSTNGVSGSVQNNASASANSAGGSSTPSCDNNRYPPNHPLSGSKHLCAICEDRASGKHYGVYSCEGCKGFFKRTVRKDLTYVCRDDKNCIVDKRQRNRCQYCRYQKCLEMGMKREAVQEERQRNKPENEVESSTNASTPTATLISVSALANQTSFLELTIERLLEAEKQIDIKRTDLQIASNIKIATREIDLLFRWIRMIPYFSSLPFDDQVTLLKTGWNELLIAEFSYRSTNKNDALVLANGVEVSKQASMVAGIGDIFVRVLNELVAKMREMEMDRSEIGCLRAIVLFNPAIKNLKDSALVERLRDRVYSVLEQHCRVWYQDKTSRFAKLLVRLPALRSIGLKCVEHLFFQKFLQETCQKQTIDRFILQMLKAQVE